MVIDSHQHFWRYNPVRDAWINASMSALQRDFLPEDLKPELDVHGVDACIAVQADQSETETNFLLELAEKHDFIKAVVGWIDLSHEDVADRLAHFSQFKKLSGFRHVVQGEREVNFLLGKDFCRGIAALEDFNFTYDILVFPHHLGVVLEFVRRFPRQKFVIDHLAKPYIKDGFFDGWAALMREIGKCENVSCKISGMVTEADWENWRYENFTPYLDHVVKCFGVKRLMFGSDWPVCLLAGGYGDVIGVVRKYFEDFTSAEKARVFGKNALAFYGSR